MDFRRKVEVWGHIMGVFSTMGDNQSECGIYPIGNKSDPFHIGNVYGGIPTNLITNAIGWLLLMILFIMIRKSAFKYMKVENIGDLLSNTEKNISRVIQVFFSASEPKDKTGDCEEGLANNAFRPSPASSPSAEENGVDTIAVCDDNSGGDSTDGQVRDRSPTTDSISDGLLNNRRLELARQNSVLREGDSFWAWIVQSVTFSESTMLKLAGPDAVQYLR